MVISQEVYESMSAEKLGDGGTTKSGPEAASTGSGQPAPAQVKVDVSNRDYRVLARRGFYAPKE